MWYMKMDELCSNMLISLARRLKTLSLCKQIKLFPLLWWEFILGIIMRNWQIVISEIITVSSRTDQVCG